MDIDIDNDIDIGIDIEYTKCVAQKSDMHKNRTHQDQKIVF